MIHIFLTIIVQVRGAINENWSRHLIEIANQQIYKY